jgi:hypothetical protein
MTPRIHPIKGGGWILYTDPDSDEQPARGRQFASREDAERESVALTGQLPTVGIEVPF